MRCRRCGQEMKIKAVEVGKDAQGNPIYNDYAFCYECKIKINLDKKKAKSEKAPEKEDLSLTRQFEAQVEQLVGKDIEEEPEDALNYVKEEVTVQEQKAPKKKQEPKRQSEKRPEKRPEKKAEDRAKEQPERRPVKAEKRPERQGKESKKQQEKRFKEMPEKRVKEVRARTKKKKGKGIVKALVFILIMAAIGAAIYFNRETVKGWIQAGIEKFDSMTDKKDDDKKEKDDENDASSNIEDIVDQIDAASDENADNANAEDPSATTDPSAATNTGNTDAAADQPDASGTE